MCNFTCVICKSECEEDSEPTTDSCCVECLELTDKMLKDILATKNVFERITLTCEFCSKPSLNLIEGAICDSCKNQVIPSPLETCHPCISLLTKIELNTSVTIRMLEDLGFIVEKVAKIVQCTECLLEGAMDDVSKFVCSGCGCGCVKGRVVV